MLHHRIFLNVYKYIFLHTHLSIPFLPCAGNKVLKSICLQCHALNFLPFCVLSMVLQKRGASRRDTHLAGTVLVSSIITADGGERLYITEQPSCFTIAKKNTKSYFEYRMHFFPAGSAIVKHLGCYVTYNRLNTEAYRTTLSDTPLLEERINKETVLDIS